MVKKYLIVVKIYEGEYDTIEAYQLQEIDMFSRWTDKKPTIEDLRDSLCGKLIDIWDDEA